MLMYAAKFFNDYVKINRVMANRKNTEFNIFYGLFTFDVFKF